MSTKSEILNKVIKELMDRGTGLHSVSDFAKKIGYDYNNIINGTKGKGDRYLTKKFFTRVHEEYPFFNKEWLLSGKGEMLNAGDKTKEYYMAKYAESLETINIKDKLIIDLQNEKEDLNKIITNLSIKIEQLKESSRKQSGGSATELIADAV